MKHLFGSFVAIGGLSLSLLVVQTQPAHAYLDPGTGSIILQSIIGGIAAATAFGAMYWARLKDFVLRRQGKGPVDGDAESK